MDKDLEVDINCHDMLRPEQHRRCRKHSRPGAVVDHLFPACRPHINSGSERSAFSAELLSSFRNRVANEDCGQILENQSWQTRFRQGLGQNSTSARHTPISITIVPHFTLPTHHTPNTLHTPGGTIMTNNTASPAFPSIYPLLRSRESPGTSTCWGALRPPSPFPPGASPAGHPGSAPCHLAARAISAAFACRWCRNLRSTAWPPSGQRTPEALFPSPRNLFRVVIMCSRFERSVSPRPHVSEGGKRAVNETVKPKVPGSASPYSWKITHAGRKELLQWRGRNAQEISFNKKRD